MGGFTVRIEGLRELDARLEQMKTSQAKRVLRHGLDVGGEVMRAAIAEAAPERPDLPSGDALPVGAMKRDVVVRRTRWEGLLAVAVGPSWFTRRAAGWVEYGHRLVLGGESRLTKAWFRGVRYLGPGEYIKEVPAHPFIRPAYEAVREECVAAMVETMKRDVSTAAMGGQIRGGDGE